MGRVHDQRAYHWRCLCGLQLLFSNFHRSLRRFPERGTVDFVEETGSEIYVKLNCEGQPVYCLFRERMDIRFNQTLGIGIDPATIHLFEKATGKRI